MLHPPMHLMNYRETACCIIILTTACRSLSSNARSTSSSPSVFCTNLSVTILFSSRVFTFSFSLTWERIGVHRFVCSQVLSTETIFIELCSAERWILSKLHNWGIHSLCFSLYWVLHKPRQLPAPCRTFSSFGMPKKEKLLLLLLSFCPQHGWLTVAK